MAGRKYRLSEHNFVRYVDDIRRSEVAYLAGRERLGLALAEDVRRQKEAGGGSPSDAELRRTARSREAQAAVEAVWPAVSAPPLIFELLSERDVLHAAARGILDEAEIELLRSDKIPSSVKRAKWSIADAVLIDEAAGLLNRVRSYGRVILDEAQDLAPMRCREPALALHRTGAPALVVGPPWTWLATDRTNPRYSPPASRACY